MISFSTQNENNTVALGKRAYVYDGLTVFAPFWAMAAIFSIAADTNGLLGYSGIFYAILSWSVVLLSLSLLLYPRHTDFLVYLAIILLLLYAVRMPVASNNKTIAAVMNGAILFSAAAIYMKKVPGTTFDRTALYQQTRVVARALLAVMYFYGIFHKINSDFLDPSVSCAVGLYVPLARPFGLDDNIFGRYLAIYSNFVVEAIAIIALYWKRYFAVGLIIALVFHYVIPISAYSWYMDFSSLVFALYVLSIPTPASQDLYGIALRVVIPLRQTFGRPGLLLPPALLVLVATVLILLLADARLSRAFDAIVHSAWILMWSVVGGIAMIAMSYVALQHFPCENISAPKQPAWIYAIPSLFFLSCLSPYIGLKTESSINMFSNLHTEGGETNHLLFPSIPYVFGYQTEVVKILDSSEGYPERHLVKESQEGKHHILFELKKRLRWNPNSWFTYVRDGQTVSRATAATFGADMPNLLERKILIFKPVDFNRPKVCTH
jgi:hypothetical protein